MTNALQSAIESLMVTPTRERAAALRAVVIDTNRAVALSSTNAAAPATSLAVERQ